MAGNGAYQQFLCPTSKETYPIRVWRAFLQVRRDDGFKTVIREKVKQRMGDTIMEEDDPGPSLVNWERNFDRVFQDLINDGIIFHVEEDEYDMTERAHDILEGAHEKHEIPWEAFTDREERTVVRECVWHFPSTARRRKVAAMETGKATGESVKKPRVTMSEGPVVRTSTGRPRGRPRGSGLRRSMAPRATNYPPLNPTTTTTTTRRHKSNSPVRQMEVDPPEPQSPEIDPPEQNRDSADATEPISHPIPSNQQRYPSNPPPPPRSHSVPHIPPPIQPSVSHQTQMSQQPTPDPSTPSPSPEESSQPPVPPPPPPEPMETEPIENAELEELRRDNRDLLDQFIEASEAIKSSEHLESDQKLRDRLGDALENLACTEREANRRATEIIALRKKIKALESVVQYQSTEGPIHEMIERRDQEIKELRATTEAQASSNISLQRRLDDALVHAKDSDTFANRAELRVLDLETDLQKLIDVSRAAVAKQEKTIEAEREENARLKQKVHGLGQALNELRDSRGQALDQAREEIHRMSEQLRMAEQTNALRRTMPPPPPPPKSRPSTSGMPTEADEFAEAIRTIEQQKNSLTKLRGRLDFTKTTIDDQASKLQRCQEEINGLKKQIGTLEVNRLTFDALRHDLQAKDELLAKLQHVASAYDREKMGFFQQIDALKYELNKVHEQLANCSSERDQLVEQKTRLTEQTERLQKASDEHIECLNQSFEVARKWESEASRRQMSLETQKGEIKKLQFEAKQRADELVSARKVGSRVDSLEKELRELKEQEGQNMAKMSEEHRVEVEQLSLLQQVALTIAEQAQKEMKTLKERAQELEQSNQGLQRELEVERARLPDAKPSTSEEPQPAAEPMEVEQPAEHLQKEPTSEEPPSKPPSEEKPSISPPNAHQPVEPKEEERSRSRSTPISASSSLLALQAQYGNDDDYEMEDVQKTADVISEKTNVSKSPTVPKRKASRASVLKATRPGPS